MQEDKSPTPSLLNLSKSPIPKSSKSFQIFYPQVFQTSGQYPMVACLAFLIFFVKAEIQSRHQTGNCFCSLSI